MKLRDFVKLVKFKILNFIKYRFFFCKISFLNFFFNFTRPTILSRDIGPSKKIVIYGFGPYGEEFFIKLFSRNRVEGIYDIKYESLGAFVENPALINSKDFDYVIVTVMDDNARKSVINFLKEKNIPQEKIVYVNYVL